MNKRLEELIQRVPQWPPHEQEQAVAALEQIEELAVWERNLNAEDRAKLKDLREMIRKSIAEGGDYTPDDVDAMINEMAARSAKVG
jgi:hypothetical protein